jgi:hypothetical protein
MRSAPPKQNRHHSVQDVETPRDLLDAVEDRWGKLDVDLACSRENRKAPVGLCWPAQDALANTVHWTSLGLRRWLNPPFGNIAPFAEKCHRTCLDEHHMARQQDPVWPLASLTFLLVPASVGSNWWAEHVHRVARVMLLSPRIKFVDHASGFPKDLALCVYGLRPGYDLWRYRK